MLLYPLLHRRGLGLDVWHNDGDGDGGGDGDGDGD